MNSKMRKYQNISGDSGIFAYEIGIHSIRIKFADGSTYLYTNESTGHKNIEKMKLLAKKGKGLCTFINMHVRNNYAEKLN